MKKFKIIYWLNGNIKKVDAEAETKQKAKMLFLMKLPCDDIISIEEVE